MSPASGVKSGPGSQRVQPLPSLRGPKPAQETPLRPNMAAAASRPRGELRLLAVTAAAAGRGGHGVKGCCRGSG